MLWFLIIAVTYIVASEYREMQRTNRWIQGIESRANVRKEDRAA